jgi:hypothetical protein
MSKRWIKAAQIDQTIDLFILDSSSTTGAGLTGLTSGSSGLTCYYRKGATGTAQPLTLASQTVGGAHTDGGFVAIDGTNMPGLYRLDLSDTMVAVEGMLTILLKGATNMAPVVAELEIVDIDIYDSMRLGLTALPNAAAEASGGIATLSAAQSSNGTIPANMVAISGDTTAADNLELATDGGVYNVGGGGIVASSVTGNVGGNVTGSVGSVTGNVGGNVVGSVASVTGNLGGNVVGSVASVTGNVGGNVVGSVASVTGNVLGSVNSVVSDVTLANNNVNANTVSDTAAQEIANAVWTANIAQTYSVGGVPAANWANNTFGDRVVISDSNNQNEVAITGSNHIAADIHEIQSQEIIDIAQGVLTEATSTNTATYAVGDVGNVLGRLVNMIAADGADFQFTANALELAPSGGGGGGGSTTVRMGPFVIKAEGQGSEEPLDINKGATHAIECQLVDSEGTGVDITGATLTAKVYNSAGSLIETVSGTISYAALGQVRWTIGTTTTNTAGTYTVTITRTTGASDTQIFGPLRVYVRDI